MADTTRRYVDIILRFRSDGAQASAKRAARAMRDVKRAAEEAWEGERKAADGAAFVGGALDALTKRALEAGAALLSMETIKRAWELGELGARAERAETAFVNISGGAARASEMLRAMQAATGGALSQMEAMLAANRLMQMGLASTPEELYRVAHAATVLGTALGRDAASSINDFSLMLANQSIMRLDNFGISSGKVRARIAELRAEFPQMTSDVAFFQATMEQAEVAMARAGDATHDAASEFERLGASIEDLKVAVGRGMSDFWADVARGATYVVRTTTELINTYRELNDTFGGTTVAAYQHANRLDELVASLGRVKSAEETARDAMDVGAGALGRYTEAVAAADELTQRLTYSTEELGRIADASASALRAAGANAKEMREADVALKLALGEITPLELQHQEALRELAQLYVSGSLTADEYAQRIIDLKRSWGELDNTKLTLMDVEERLRRVSQATADGRMTVQEYVSEVRKIKEAWGSIPSRVETVYEIRTIGGIPSLSGPDHQVQFFAEGGVSPGGLAWVGEAGPELVYLPRGAEVVPSWRSRQMVSNRTDNRSYTVIVQDSLSAALIAEALREEGVEL